MFSSSVGAASAPDAAPTELEIFLAVFYKHCAPTEREVVSQRAEGLDMAMPKQEQQERLVECNLTTDLQKAVIGVEL
jgi:hypothetical protein